MHSLHKQPTKLLHCPAFCPVNAYYPHWYGGVVVGLSVLVTAGVMAQVGANSLPPLVAQAAGNTYIVHANEGYYKDEPAPEGPFQGVLKETGREIVNYPLYRDFYLLQDNGTQISIQYQDSPDMILGSLLGRRVEIRGKLVDRTAEGGRRELWVGYITPLDPAPACTNPSPIPTGFAAPCPVLSLSPTSVPSSGSLTISLTKPAGPAYLYKLIYVYNHSRWQAVPLPGPLTSNTWLTADSNLSQTPASAGLTPGTHYVASWDWTWDAGQNCYLGPGSTTCNQGSWRLQSFNVQ